MTERVFDNKNKGILFYRETKMTDNHPDFTGNIDVDGKEYRLAGWKRHSKKGLEFISLSISEPRKPGISDLKVNVNGTHNKNKNKEIDLDDDIPF